MQKLVGVDDEYEGELTSEEPLTNIQKRRKRPWVRVVKRITMNTF